MDAREFWTNFALYKLTRQIEFSSAHRNLLLIIQILYSNVPRASRNS